MKTAHVIIQAGGKGLRLKELTRNKPKGIVPVNNKPIIFNLFDKLPDKRFVVIGDYLFDVLKKYLEAFAKVKCVPVKAGGTGTCGGLRQALELVPDNVPFMLVWSDLILGAEFNLDFDVTENLVGISKDFECRWSYTDGVFAETPSSEHGVAGLFVFKNKAELKDVPESGELVAWLSRSGLEFAELGLWGTREVGTLSAYNESENKDFRCRPFNEMFFENGKVVKRYRDKQGEQLAAREISWYREARTLGFGKIPEIYEYSPLTMKQVNGYNIFKRSYTHDEKLKLINNLIEALSELHALKSAPCDKFSIIEAYYTKTVQRLSIIRDMLPFAGERHITINGRRCRNVFFYKDELYDRIRGSLLDAKFAFIHGDCTFSNTMADDDLNITFIDPRGYFGFTELYGDTLYDWAKVYYSVYGNYDRFNNKHFTLDINETDIKLNIASNGFEDAADYFLKSIPHADAEKIKLIHAVIWLSLTTYAWEDYDSICGAFYNGLYYLEELL